MQVEWGRDAEGKRVIVDGTIISMDKLLCPECGTVHRETTIRKPDVAGLEWSATCPAGHTWRFFA